MLSASSRTTCTCDSGRRRRRGSTQIRRYGRTNVAVSVAMLEAIAAIAPVVRRPADREALLRQARMIEAHAGQAVPEPHDRADLRSRFEAVTAALGRAC